MPRNFRQKWWAKVRCLVGIITIVGGTSATPFYDVRAENCPDVKIIFARGSGGERWTDQNYLAFKNSLEPKLKTLKLNYEFLDLDYPAIGIDNLSVLIGAYTSAGEAYDFGESVNAGINKLISEVNNGHCKNTKYILGGYSQGAMVVSKSIHNLSAEKIIYAATFGDPKIYLPEGKSYFTPKILSSSDKNILHIGTVPEACKGQNLSSYRTYVPDCYTYEGLLGSYQPYAPNGFEKKMGTWCNKKDIFCSSYLSISDHTSYVSDNLYEDAARVIAAKVADFYNIKGNVFSPHDTAILIDSTGSMSGLIDKYKNEATSLAEKTLASGGRIALYDYRDVGEGYAPVERCNFEACTMESFKAGLNAILVDGGGDEPESLLSASFNVMQKLSWQRGATKSVVVLTDAGYHSPDLDGVTFYDVVNLSREIDPVNFYIITTPQNFEFYNSLAAETDGAVVSAADNLGLLTENIMERYDSLPRVEYNDGDIEIPGIEIEYVEDSGGDKVKIKVKNSGTKIMIVLNDAILGVVEDEEFIIDGLKRDIINNILLMPLSDTRRGIGAEITLGSFNTPKTPDAGIIK